MNRFQRIVVRALGLSTRRFEAASGRRWSGLADQRFGSYGPETIGATDAIRRRARASVANNPWAGNGVGALTGNIVGAGITPTAQHPDEQTRRAMTAAFNTWSAICDADGLTDFFGLQAAATRAMIVDGEAFVRLIWTDAGLKLQLVPAELVDLAHTVELGSGARIIAGIEFDAAGERVAYHVRPMDPTSVFETHLPPIRIPAADMLHLFRPMGPGQVRGVSWLAPVLIRADELDQLEDALLVGVKVAAMHAGFLVDQNNSGGTPYDGVTTGSILESGLEPGVLKVLPGGFDIRFSTPQQAQQTVDFAKLQLRGIAAGLGVPEYMLTGDLSGANYSSLRAGLIEFRRRVEAVQFHTLIPQLLRPIWNRFVTVQMLTGQLDAADLDAAKACEWIPPAEQWVDPEKDVNATTKMIAAGLTSRRRAVAAQGYAVEDLDDEILADRERETRSGLSFGEKETANAA